MMSQNRQAEKDRLQSTNDYEVNIKAELEILALHEKFDDLREGRWKDLVEMQQRQIELLEQLLNQARSLNPEGPTRSTWSLSRDRRMRPWTYPDYSFYLWNCPIMDI